MKIFSVFTSKLFGGASIVLLLACAALWVRGNHYQHDRDSWKSAFAAQKKATIAVAAAAKAKAIAQRIRTENTYAEAARRADNANRKADEFRAAAQRYARIMRAKAAGNGTGGAGTAGEDSPAPGDNGPGESPGFLYIRQDQFDILVENTDRLIRAHDWGQDLIDRKLAIPEVEFGKTQGD